MLSTMTEKAEIHSIVTTIVWLPRMVQALFYILRNGTLSKQCELPK